VDRVLRAIHALGALSDARYINQTIAIWLKRKYKRFRHRLGRARIFLEKIARENRRLFAHWQLGIGDKLA
jgi:hypothetical protein